MTIFDNVFVPWERVFLCGEWQYAGALANTFVEFHRFTAAAYKLPMCELFIGVAALIAEYNGIPKVTHVRNKLMELIAWTETTRGLLVAASVEHKMVPPGVAVPNITLTNIAKHHFAHNYHLMCISQQDVAHINLATILCVVAQICVKHPNMRSNAGASERGVVQHLSDQYKLPSKLKLQ